jgi:hypothetical protein
MAAKKARKRAYIPPSSEVVNKRERAETTRTVRSSAQRSGGGGRGSYEYPTPSLGRTLKRLPIYFLMLFALQYFLLNNEGKVDGIDLVIAAGATAGLVTLVFAPFMHMMDRMAYNRYQRKMGAGSDKKQ